MTNVDLLRQTMDHIEAQPENWDQLHWARRTPCGTAGCFAGTALMLAGQAEFTWSTRIDDGLIFADEMLDGRDIGDAAQELLGLDMDDADGLFDPNNTLDQLRDWVAKLTAEATAEVTA